MTVPLKPILVAQTHVDDLRQRTELEQRLQQVQQKFLVLKDEWRERQRAKAEGWPAVERRWHERRKQR